MAEVKDQCVVPAAGPISQEPSSGGQAASAAPAPAGASQVTARVGKAAPDFEASAFVNGGFENIKLSDYAGKWVVLCFYPGDFTFV